MGINVKLNGENEELPGEKTVSELLAERRVREEYVTVEVNEEIIDKEEYATTLVKDGDQVEFIYYMGGGEESR